MGLHTYSYYNLVMLTWCRVVTGRMCGEIVDVPPCCVLHNSHLRWHVDVASLSPLNDLVNAVVIGVHCAEMVN